MLNAIASFLAIFIRPLYEWIGNYGWTLVVFTVFVKILTLPLNIKSQRSTAKMQQIQPLVEEINRKYKNDQAKAQAELQNLYAKFGVNPMGGCLPMIVQMIVLFGLIRVIYQPYTYILNLTAEEVSKLYELTGETFVKNSEIRLMAHWQDGSFVQKLAEFGKGQLDLNFFGINLGEQPSLTHPGILWIIPALAVVATAASGFLTTRLTNRGVQSDQSKQMSNSMLFTMPVITAVFAFQMPCAAALYWLVSTLSQMLVQFVITKFIVKPLPQIKRIKKKKPVKIETTAEETEGEDND